MVVYWLAALKANRAVGVCRYFVELRPTLRAHDSGVHNRVFWRNAPLTIGPPCTWCRLILRCVLKKLDRKSLLVGYELCMCEFPRELAGPFAL